MRTPSIPVPNQREKRSRVTCPLTYVPYMPYREPYVRKCAFDVGDYGLGYCTLPLTLGCDCLGRIHYFDATLSNSK